MSTYTPAPAPTPDWDAILDSETCFTITGKGFPPGGGIVQLTYLSNTEATFCWGDPHDGAASAPIEVNGIGTRGYMRFAVRMGEWHYDGGAIYRTDGFLVNATDSQRSKLIAALREALTGLTDETKAIWALKNAKAEVQRSKGATEAAEATLREARVAERNARNALGAACSAYLATVQP